MINECFVISPIGDHGSPIRRHADQLLKHVIKPVAEALGYEVTRADQVDEPGMITHQIIRRLVGAPLVIADLTEHNPNVFYELAIRHAGRMPLIHMARSGERLPFDIAGFRTIFFDLTDPDSVEATKTALSQQISSLASGLLESPVSVALNFERLETSGNPQDQTLADILQGVTDFKVTLQAVTNKMPDARDCAHAMFNPAYLEALRAAVPLSKVIGRKLQLKKAGREWRALSPFHEEGTPSFFVNDQRCAWFDFASGKNGDVFSWFMEVESLSFTQAVLRTRAVNAQMEQEKSEEGFDF